MENKNLKVLTFDCKGFGVGNQVLVFKNEDFNVILRNQKKHNKVYKITIEEVDTEIENNENNNN